MPVVEGVCITARKSLHELGELARSERRYQQVKSSRQQHKRVNRDVVND